MSFALTIVASYDPMYLRIAEHLVRRDIASGHHAVVLDTSTIASVPAETYHRGALNVFGIRHPGYDIAQRMKALGAEYANARQILQGIPNVSLTVSQLEQLDIAIESALITYYRTDRPNRKVKRIGRTARALEAEGLAVFGVVNHMMYQRPFALMNVANGRFPGQKMAFLAAESHDVPTFHFEKGETPAGAYVQPYAPQNRLVSQAAVETVLAGVPSQQVIETAETWMARRAPASKSSNASSNEYSANWVNRVPSGIVGRTLSVQDERLIVGFFTSSQDEFMFLGPEWQLHAWESQAQAFDTLMTYFESLGAICYLRIHPNLATKAHECFVRERREMKHLAERHPNLIVIDHDVPVSSYALLDHSDAVVVWDSTIGLEASARGIPVWTCAASRYGEIADVREVFGPDKVTDELMHLYDVDVYGAQKYIAYLVMRDQQLNMALPGWEPWDQARPPMALAIAGLMVAGGNPSVRDAVQSTVDVWRHRKLTFNWASLKTRFGRQKR